MTDRRCLRLVWKAACPRSCPSALLPIGDEKHIVHHCSALQAPVSSVLLLGRYFITEALPLFTVMLFSKMT